MWAAVTRHRFAVNSCSKPRNSPPSLRSQCGDWLSKMKPRVRVALQFLSFVNLMQIHVHGIVFLLLAKVMSTQRIKSFTIRPCFKENQHFFQEWLFQGFQLAMKNRINYLGTKAYAVSHAVCGIRLVYCLLLTLTHILFLCVFVCFVQFVLTLDILTGIQESRHFLIFQKNSRALSGNHMLLQSNKPCVWYI